MTPLLLKMDNPMTALLADLEEKVSELVQYRVTSLNPSSATVWVSQRLESLCFFLVWQDNLLIGLSRRGKLTAKHGANSKPFKKSSGTGLPQTRAFQQNFAANSRQFSESVPSTSFLKNAIFFKDINMAAASAEATEQLLVSAKRIFFLLHALSRR